MSLIETLTLKSNPHEDPKDFPSPCTATHRLLVAIARNVLEPSGQRVIEPSLAGRSEASAVSHMCSSPHCLHCPDVLELD
ncbi:hypothetical protein AURDEDRAFT_174141 [Auricularia subglabra TFB-10046 SS5]|nr:hypothetical protein AURDEDRAFT_174141 [Auricularia subglabra TFB-10046 SS5]